MSAPATAPIDVGRMLDEGDWSGYQRLLVVLTATAIIFDGVDLQLLGVALPSIMREWSLPRPAFATAFATGLFGMMIGGALAGVVGDRVGRRTALIGSVLIFGVLSVATAAAHDLTTLSVLRFLTGVGLGGAVPNAAALSSEYVPRRHRPFAVTLTIVCIPLGGTLAGMLAIHILPAYGWRVLYLIGGVIPIATALLLFAFLPESPRFLARHPRRWPDLARSLRRMGHAAPADATFIDPGEQAVAHGSFRALLGHDFRSDTLALWSAFFSCLLAVYLGFNWVPAMLTGAGMSPTVASTGITAYNLGGVLGAVGGAFAFARIGSKATMLGMAAGAIAGALVLRSMAVGPATAPMPIIIMLGVTGGLINAVQTTMYALAAQVYPVGIRATGVGAAASIGRTGAITSTYAGAWALEAGGSRLFFSFVAVAMLAAFAALALVKRHILGPTLRVRP